MVWHNLPAALNQGGIKIPRGAIHPWLANYLFEQGMPMSSRMTVGDNLSALVAAMTECSLRADVLIVNGGRGTTSDDLSALAAATAAGDELVEHAEWLAKMTAYFAERGREMASSNRKQALIPASAELIDNPVGTRLRICAAA